MNTKPLGLLVFETDAAAIRANVAAGLHEVMIDCEWRGKVDRQHGADTDTSYVEIDGVAAAASVPGAFVHCRINAHGVWTEEEIETAIAAGAQQIFLPMLRRIDEVEHFLHRIDGRAHAAILVETDDAVRIAPDLATLPLAAVYVGLNDLAISRGKTLIFEALLDGTVEKLRECFAGKAFGFGGVTIPGRGAPIAGDLLLAEMQRLDCDFSFLRRSWHRDVAGRDLATEAARLREFWLALCQRDAATRETQQRALHQRIRELLAAPVAIE